MFVITLDLIHRHQDSKDMIYFYGQNSMEPEESGIKRLLNSHSYVLAVETLSSHGRPRGQGWQKMAEPADLNLIWPEFDLQKMGWSQVRFFLLEKMGVDHRLGFSDPKKGGAGLGCMTCNGPEKREKQISFFPTTIHFQWTYMVHGF